VDFRADIWALGVILQELVTGKAPFSGSSLGEVCESILDRRAAPLRLPNGSDHVLEGALAGCLAKDPADRYQDVRGFAEAFVRFGSADAKASMDRIVRITEAKSITAPTRPPRLGSHVPTLASERRERQSSGGARFGRLWAPLAIALGALGFGATAFITSRPPRRDIEPDAAGASLSPAVPSAPASALPAAVEREAPMLAPRPEPDAGAAAPRPAIRPAKPASSRAIEKPRAPGLASAPAPSSSAAPDPLGLDTGALFKDRR
jgi:serine/threonine protein kinase